MLVAGEIIGEEEPLLSVALHGEDVLESGMSEIFLQLLVNGHLLELTVHQFAHHLRGILHGKRVGRNDISRLGARDEEPDEESDVHVVRLVAIILLLVHVIERQVAAVELVHALRERIPHTQVREHVLVIHRQHDGEFLDVASLKSLYILFCQQFGKFGGESGVSRVGLAFHAKRMTVGNVQSSNSDCFHFLYKL